MPNLDESDPRFLRGGNGHDCGCRFEKGGAAGIGWGRDLNFCDIGGSNDREHLLNVKASLQRYLDRIGTMLKNH